MRLFIFGVGYTAQALIEAHRPLFSRIGGTVRTDDKARALRGRGVAAHVLNGTAVSDSLLRDISDADAILAGIPPGEAGDPALSLLLSGGVEMHARWVGYLSTVGVYGDHGGAWVDEMSPAVTRVPRSMRRLAAEESWRALAAAAGARGLVFRLPGIYGPGRNTLRDLATGTARNIVKDGQVFNRAHVADIAAAIAAAIRDETADGIYNVADDEPAAQGEVVAFAAGLLGVAPPAPVDFATAELSDMVRSFHLENKRVANARLKTLPGFRLTYPTYREGLAALHAQGEGRTATATLSRITP